MLKIKDTLFFKKAPLNSQHGPFFNVKVSREV